MSTSVLYMSMSLDGYIAGPNDEPANPGGDGFDRLHEWIVTPDGEFGRPEGPAGQLWDEWNAAGAVLAGRRTVEQVDHWGGDHHGVPIFVPSHRPPGPSVANYPLVTYVTDGIASAMATRRTADDHYRTAPGSGGSAARPAPQPRAPVAPCTRHAPSRSDLWRRPLPGPSRWRSHRSRTSPADTSRPTGPAADG